MLELLHTDNFSGINVAANEYSGGKYYPDENFFSSPILWQRAKASLLGENLTPQASDRTYEEQILLAEVSLLTPSLEIYGKDNLPEEVLQYVSFNEKTAMLEAVTSGVISQTYRKWSPEIDDCIAYGYPTIPMYKAGIKEANRIAKQNPQYDFEVKRRVIELVDAQILNHALKEGILKTHNKVTISPFPEDTDEETATKLGYFRKNHAAMVRLYNYDEVTHTLITTQITLSNSNSEAFKALIARLSEGKKTITIPIAEDVSPSTQILATQIYLPKDQLTRGVVDLAQLYDDVLRDLYSSGNPQTNDENYCYLGVAGVKTNQHYEDLWEKTQLTENDLKGLVQEMVNTDIELAVSLKEGKPTPPIEQIIREVLNLDDSSLDSEYRLLLEDALSNNLTEKSAAIIKKLQMIKICSIASSIANPERAKDLFGEENSAFMRKAYQENPQSILNDHSLIQMIADAKPDFSFCGASISSRSNMLNKYLDSSLADIKGSLLGGEGKFVKKCGKCGITIEAVISKGYRCNNCGGVYQGC